MRIDRRQFLKYSSTCAGLSLLPIKKNIDLAQENWPVGKDLGRNCTGGIINLRSKPTAESEIISSIYEDAVFPWNREIIGEAPAGLISKRWVETSEGYVYAPSVQHVKNIPNSVMEDLPEIAGVKGMWAEVTVPFVDLIQENPPARSPWLREVDHPRLYFSQVVWVDGIRKESEGRSYYRINELYGNPGDIFWAKAEGFRRITEEEVQPISPEVENKKVVVDINHQSLSCYEDQREVYYCRISSGAKFNAAGEIVDAWSTPPGPHPIFRKLFSIHMSGDVSGAGWDTPGIGWTSFFAQGGVAIHSTFWHNNFGVPVSHGCVNAKPEDSKWIFRWVQPIVAYIPGDLTVGMPGGTIVDVIQA